MKKSTLTLIIILLIGILPTFPTNPTLSEMAQSIAFVQAIYGMLDVKTATNKLLEAYLFI